MFESGSLVYEKYIHKIYHCNKFDPTTFTPKTGWVTYPKKKKKIIFWKRWLS